ncbi:hypothetical protein Tco_0296112 [Tanacetum coccineum]
MIAYHAEYQSNLSSSSSVENGLGVIVVKVLNMGFLNCVKLWGLKVYGKLKIGFENLVLMSEGWETGDAALRAFIMDDWFLFLCQRIYKSVGKGSIDRSALQETSKS